MSKTENQINKMSEEEQKEIMKALNKKYRKKQNHYINEDHKILVETLKDLQTVVESAAEDVVKLAKEYGVEMSAKATIVGYNAFVKALRAKGNGKQSV